MIASLPPNTAVLICPTSEDIGGFSGFATQRGIPIFSVTPAHIDRGALVASGLNHRAIGAQAARQMAMIIRGVSPAEDAFTINYAAARQLGLEVPEDLLLLADKVVR